MRRVDGNNKDSGPHLFRRERRDFSASCSESGRSSSAFCWIFFAAMADSSLLRSLSTDIPCERRERSRVSEGVRSGGKVEVP